MTPLLVALALVGVLLPHFHVALGVAYAGVGLAGLLLVGILGGLRRRRLRASPLSSTEAALAGAAVTMVLSAACSVLWKLLGG